MTARRIGLAVVVALLLFGTGFFTGRGTAPARVQERERLVERTTEARSNSDRQGSRQAASTAQIAADNREIIKRIRIVVAADGTQEREEVTEERAARRTEARAEQTRVEYRDRVQVVMQERWRDRETIKIVESSQRPWRAGALAGVDLDRRALAGLYAGRSLGPLDVQIAVIIPPRAIAQASVIAGLGWRF